MSGAHLQYPQLVPFSAGPAICPGRNLVLLLASAMLHAILARARVRRLRPRNLPQGRMPAGLNFFRVRFQLKD